MIKGIYFLIFPKNEDEKLKINEFFIKYYYHENSLLKFDNIHSFNILIYGLKKQEKVLL